MKTHAIEWTELEHAKDSGQLNTAGRLNSATHLATRGILALVPSAILIFGAIFLVKSPDLAVYLQATLWASGFVFFGLALDQEKAAIGLSIATGFALPALALMSANIAVEFALVAVALVSAWLAVAILRR